MASEDFPLAVGPATMSTGFLGVFLDGTVLLVAEVIDAV